MAEVLLFDWGDTLMVDFPSASGKMYLWEKVEAVEGAVAALEKLAAEAEIYIATGAADSTPQEIELAFQRVGLDRYISGYFCQRNVGVEKGSAAFLPAILEALGKPKESVAVVGDSWEKDVEPAVAIGLRAYWLHSGGVERSHPLVRQISTLSELNT
ncbi:HAD family hydrolase [Biformimicrobium ophioploci]|uniref:HAD family hydrolase n=1 Tax=Biformimicrobium ophioploci TaxID=3036711 RepID=A0ABQ6M370_9GAMM|nr:HAD family hydrolase [Microbulbifer sp. NKW57]GMG88752.1 HAD family hydrolase [Microbulbifer sp. NKW57]